MNFNSKTNQSANRFLKEAEKIIENDKIILDDFKLSIK